MRSSTSIACLLIAANQPRTLPHVFTLPALRAHFAKTPPSAGAIALIDLEPGTFLDTEKENNVISAAIYVMGVKYDGMAEGKRPEGRDGLRKWIFTNRNEVIAKLAGKIEPPFTAYSITQMQSDVGAMAEGILLKALPPAAEKKNGQKEEGGKKSGSR